ncbi:MAG TPA: sigma-54 dependent transcriptional regulator [Candidatus Wallbacteria bacterium]|nr:sigma-54 dependent transcriptional regulator [Candidatus Wallbacteria bacterium]
MKIKILILLGDIPGVDFIQKLLSMNRYTVDARTSHTEIVDISRLGSFDLLIADVSPAHVMPHEYLADVRNYSPGVHIIGVASELNKFSAISLLNDKLIDGFIYPYTEAALFEAIEDYEKKFFANFSEAPVPKPENSAAQEVSFDNMTGHSPKMREVFAKIRSIADKDISVLIGGESGTGKELVAQAIHNHSNRKNFPFIKVNCAAIPDTLIESELFGHEKGSFTGAVERKIGKFEMANHGTLFLDEIGDMALTTQAKVLRIIQEREFERIGGVKPIKVNVRIITATHRNLVTEVREKRFREDLFFRLNVVSILIPTLRDRREDILPLCEFFIKKFCKKFEKHPKRLSLDVIEAITEYSWPGNVRELQNVIESAVAVEESDVITIASLPYQVGSQETQRFFRRKTDAAAGDVFNEIEVNSPPASSGDVKAAAASGIKSIVSETSSSYFGNNEKAGIEKLDEVAPAVDALIKSGISIEKMEELIVRAALLKTGGRQIEAARILGIGKGEIQYKLKKYCIKASEYKKISSK